jgi:hypothetical protein
MDVFFCMLSLAVQFFDHASIAFKTCKLHVFCSTVNTTLLENQKIYVALASLCAWNEEVRMS